MAQIREYLKTVPCLRQSVIHARTVRDRLRSRLFNRRQRHYVRFLQKIRNINKGRRGWVLGNGPSLTSLDLSLLKDEVTFACNGIWLLYDELKWRPTYYFVEDHLVAEDDAATISQLSGSKKIFPLDQRAVLPPDKDTFYVNFIRGNYPGFPRFSEQCDKEVFWGGTVAYMMLQLAWWTGC